MEIVRIVNGFQRDHKDRLFRGFDVKYGILAIEAVAIPSSMPTTSHFDEVSPHRASVQRLLNGKYKPPNYSLQLITASHVDVLHGVKHIPSLD